MQRDSRLRLDNHLANVDIPTDERTEGERIDRLGMRGQQEEATGSQQPVHIVEQGREVAFEAPRLA
jgi:hypothetical protein